VTGGWLSPFSSTNKTDHYDIPEILLKVALNTINQPNNINNKCNTSYIKYEYV
jgi:hypothetical protein